MKTESWAMSICKRLGLKKMAWTLRRLHCPIAKDALVLEIGSGGNPYSRANILLDAYEITKERHYAHLKADRPLILGFGEKLPFKDRVFDFVIASHVLEHSANPEKFLSELQRVAKAGYIETPDAFMERINPYTFHRLEITKRRQKLMIRKKKNWLNDKELVELYEYKAKKYITSRCFSNNPELFHVRHYWQDKIDFIVLNPEVDCSWVSPKDKKYDLPVRRILRNGIIDLIRGFLSQNKRNRSLNILDLLVCPKCVGGKFVRQTQGIICLKCHQVFRIKDNIIVMNAGEEQRKNYDIL